jgi:ADP-dependent NAD(P)H-hydrate dehydratase / NAD(P)H-hydrate epimerase
VRRIDFLHTEPLYCIASTRHIEQLALSELLPPTLMQRAGLAVARLALAIAPHAERFWLACGSGNNGGDGMEAAVHLQAWGKQVVVSFLGQSHTLPYDAAAAFLRAKEAQVPFVEEPPTDFDICIDALLGIGARPIEEGSRLATWIEHITRSAKPVLSVDVPSGLNADTGAVEGVCVNASHTLCMLTLKPGLFTALGRDRAQTVWLDTLGVDVSRFDQILATARLGMSVPEVLRLHASHKGSYGDVAVIGGAPGMVGAALLAATAALYSGAGRVYVGLLDANALTCDTQHAELMFRTPQSLLSACSNLHHSTIFVCGCGAGWLAAEPLEQLLASQVPLIMDADGLNAIADTPALRHLLQARRSTTTATVLTPHPLEAARLLGCSTAHIQSHRLASAEQLAQNYGCTVVLKGSGSIIARPDTVSVINPSGNAKLATAGTGDVLAGMIAARLARGLSAFDAACQAVHTHGAIADCWPDGQTLTASQLAKGYASRLM